MSTTLSTDSMLRERITHLEAAKAIVARCKSSGTDLSPDDQATVTRHLDGVKDLDKQIKGRDLVNSVIGLGNVDDLANGGKVFSEADAKGIAYAAKSRTSFRADLNMKAALTSGGLLPTSGTFVEGGLHPNAQFPIASLFLNAPADGPVVRYYRTTAGTAAVVAEGALKPDAGVSFAGIDLALSKLACIAQYSTEMSEDAGFLIAFLQQELVAAVIAAENALVISTFAATSGILTATGAATAVIDLIADAVASEEAISGMTPAAILANPTVIATIRKSKASTSGVYNVDVLSNQPAMLHGVRLVSSPAVPAANVWVACANGVTVYRRGPVSVEMGTNADDFSKNLRTVVAEERLAVAVTRPSSLFKLVLT